MEYLDDRFLRRVKQSYAIACQDSGQRGGMWDSIDALRAPIHDALMSKDNDALRTIFASPITSDLFYGTDNLSLSVERSLINHVDIDGILAEAARHKLLHLGTALGITRHVPKDAEQFTSYQSAAWADQELQIEDLLDKISLKLGIEIDFPTPFAGERGYVTTRGLASDRAISAIHQAFRVRQELGRTLSKSVLEIGPGLGRTAYYARRFGISQYATIDLPLGVVAQACFLGATLGPEAIWMIGDSEPAGARIRLLPSMMMTRPHSRVGLVLNVDSITEMNVDVSMQYMRWIADHAEVFLSINHEANVLTIPRLVEATMPGAYYFRAPYWLRPGYQEEIIQTTPPAKGKASQLASTDQRPTIST